MAKRGPKNKPTALKLITGNPGRRPLADNSVDILAAATPRTDPLVPPKKLTAVQQRLWGRFIETAWWLQDFDVPKAFMWVCLQAEHDKKPGAMIAARLAQLRVLGSELGLDPASRQRMPADGPSEKDNGQKFFDY